MKDDRVFGIVYRFGYNDYQISLADLSDEDSDAVEEIFMKYEDDCTCERGDRNMTLDDANLEYFDKKETEWVVTYKLYGSIGLETIFASSPNAVRDLFLANKNKDIQILSAVPTGR